MRMRKRRRRRRTKRRRRKVNLRMMRMLRRVGGQPHRVGEPRTVSRLTGLTV